MINEFRKVHETLPSKSFKKVDVDRRGKGENGRSVVNLFLCAASLG